MAKKSFLDYAGLKRIFKKMLWRGTKAELTTALAAGEIANGTSVQVTDDYTDPDGLINDDVSSTTTTYSSSKLDSNFVKDTDVLSVIDTSSGMPIDSTAAKSLIIDKVEDGNLNAVTSNAVNDSLTNYVSTESWLGGTYGSSICYFTWKNQYGCTLNFPRTVTENYTITCTLINVIGTAEYTDITVETFGNRIILYSDSMDSGVLGRFCSITLNFSKN